MLNRFHNLDYWFGQFMEKFNNSALAEDTIIVFTADHSVYADADYYYAYPDSTRIAYGMDKIPLFIYHAGIVPQQIDVEGRNSLDMAPTILDYLDISAPNYFLGETLFFSKSNGNNYDTVYYDGGEIWSSNLGEIQELSDTNKQEFLERLQKYFAAKTQTALY